MGIKGAFFLFMLAGMASGAAISATTYDRTVLTEPNPAPGHEFGRGISLSANGHTLAVATAANGNYGKVYIFQRDMYGWNKIQELDGVFGVDDAFGAKVLLSRDGKSLLVASAKLYQLTPTLARTYYDVYRYTKVGGIWERDHVFSDPDPATGDGFGYVLSMSADGNVVLISAPAVNRVYVYSLVGGSWARTAIKNPNGLDAPVSQFFGGGTALSPDGTRALISDDVDLSPSIAMAGQVHLYTLSGGKWRRAHTFEDPAPQSYGDQFGDGAVGFLADGSIYIGDALRSDGSHGEVYVYRQDASASWVTAAILVSPTTINFQGYFGSSLAAAGQTLLVGGSVDCIYSSVASSAYLFTQQRTGWSQTATFDDPVGCTPSADLDNFAHGGVALSIDMDVIAIASSGALLNAGSVYIYQVQYPTNWNPYPWRPWKR